MSLSDIREMGFAGLTPEQEENVVGGATKAQCLQWSLMIASGGAGLSAGHQNYLNLWNKYCKKK
ncbi:hypothetical protein [Streptomyces sp. SID14515]|uniref:hypothetical protein n=1 Tax=Streptomyces sp. SID14515 TaxID=2706074 RepID=UPI0013C6EADC|nr:hypothetical protein [Streptomyces sp. SID14515]NEB42389.1 hypothetical protein [Streptomyces sp. SID14515]